MAGKTPILGILSLQRLVDNFGEQTRVATVQELADQGVLFVEDGNHGENRPRQNEFAPTGIAFLRPPDLKDGRVDFENCGRINEAGFKRVRKGIGKPGDIILTHRATVGRIAITDHDAPEVFVTNPGTTIWRSTAPNILDQKYLYSFMRSPAFMDQLWSQVGNNCTFDYVSLTQQRGLRVAFPPVDEQKAIAAVLGTLDDKIELNRRMNETLEAMAQALFKSWFLDAAQDGLPKGWREGPLPEAIEVNPQRSLRKGDVAPYLDMANMPTHSARALEVVDREFGSGMRFIDGDTLVARITPCLENGKTCFVDFLGEGKVAWGSTEYIVLCPKPPLPPEFAYFLARTEDFRAFAISNMTGTSGRQRVPADCFDHFEVAVPPVALAEEFGQFARSVLAKMKANDDESRTLAALRDTLLPKLLSGEVRVPQNLEVA
jgi:type I restriction enzyme S subunit